MKRLLTGCKHMFVIIWVWTLVTVSLVGVLAFLTNYYKGYEEFFNTKNTIFTVSFVLFSLSSVILMKITIPTYKTKQLSDIVSKHLNSAAKDDNTLLPTLSKLLIVAAAVFCILLLMNLVFSYMGVQDQMGVFGDFMGGVLNPILSFLGFFALLLTIILQSKELKETRKEIQRSSNAQINAEKALSQQAFENTFFNMLNIHAQIVENLSFTYFVNKNTNGKLSILKTLSRFSKEEVTHGRDVFKGVIEYIKSSFTSEDDFSNSIKINSIYDNFNSNKNEVLGHYFRNIYQILKYVHEYEGIEPKQKKVYTNMLRAQLSANEIILLLVNCICNSIDEGQFKELLIEYRMLEHIPFNDNSTQERFTSISKEKSHIYGFKGAFYLPGLDLAKYMRRTDNHLVISAFGTNPTYSLNEKYLLDSLKKLEDNSIESLRKRNK